MNGSRAIKYHINQRIGLLFGIPCALLLVLAGLLIVEYRFFKQQAAAMLVLKKEYRNHMSAVNKVLKDYVKIRAMIDRYGIMETEQDTAAERAFIPINRDLEYLKQSTLDYAQEQNLSWPFASMTIAPEEWTDYTEQILMRGRSALRASDGSTTKANNLAQKKKAIKRSAKKKGAAKEKDISFSWPIKRSSFWLSSPFGTRKKPNGASEFHRGIDMAAVRGTPVNAAAAGTVIFAGQTKGYGKTVVIAHNHKYRTRYAHLDKILVKKNQTIERGEVIGKVGATGSVRSRPGNDPSHLHFEVCVFGKRVNPMYFLP
jgi:murein DD-endopeptidase MepM/ murein hydrolase activator NlpD